MAQKFIYRNDLKDGVFIPKSYENIIRLMAKYDNVPTNYTLIYEGEVTKELLYG